MTTTVEKTAIGIIIVLILVIIVITIYTFFCWLADRKRKLIDRECADIIIIGAGTAGSVLGRRLHERHPHLKILIMERGQDRHADPKVYNIAKALEIAYNEPYSETIPTKVSAALAELEVKAEVSVARLTGGASSHNLGLVVRGSPDFYNGVWQDQLKLSYKDLDRKGGVFDRIACQMEISELPIDVNVLTRIGPVFKKAYGKYDAVEATRVLQRTATVAANAGPLRAGDDFSDVLLKTLKKTRPTVKIVDDYNSGVEACASKKPRLFVDGILGIRSSSDVAYLSPSYLLRHHEAIQVGQHMTVTKIITSTSKNSIACTGVEWTGVCGKSRLTTLNHGGRVILCAGGIKSPLLLQESGIDVMTGLQKVIGRGLLNHYGCTLIFKTVTNFNFSSGPLAFVPDSRHQTESRRDWQMIVGGEILTSPTLLQKVQLTPDDANFISMITWMMHPRARGVVKSSCKGPQIRLKMFEDGDLDDNKSDIYSAVQSLRWMYEVVKQMRRDKLFSGCHDDLVVVFPPEDVMQRDSSKELETWVKIGLSQTDHYAGTCALGKVVDPKDFTVYGTKNLHVVDASVFPEISNGNTALPVLVMSEIAALRI